VDVRCEIAWVICILLWLCSPFVFRRRCFSYAHVKEIAETLDEILMLAKLNQNGNPLLAWKFSVLPWRTVQLHIPTCKFDTLSSKFEHYWEGIFTGSVAHVSGVGPFVGTA